MSSTQRFVIAIIAVLALTFGVAWVTSAQVAKPSERSKWEYAITEEGRGAKGMNEYGREGWEMVAVIQEVGRPPTIFYKRPKSD